MRKEALGPAWHGNLPRGRGLSESIAALAHTPALPLCARTQGGKREQHDQPREAPREALVRGPGSFSAG